MVQTSISVNDSEVNSDHSWCFHNHISQRYIRASMESCDLGWDWGVDAGRSPSCYPKRESPLSVVEPPRLSPPGTTKIEYPDCRFETAIMKGFIMTLLVEATGLKTLTQVDRIACSINHSIIHTKCGMWSSPSNYVIVRSASVTWDRNAVYARFHVLGRRDRQRGASLLPRAKVLDFPRKKVDKKRSGRVFVARWCNDPDL